MDNFIICFSKLIFNYFVVVNDPIERLKEERDGIVLSPQRRSFGTGCHVQTQVSYTRQISMPERDRDDTKIERERERERDRER